MKIRISKSACQRGSVLMVTLFSAMFIGMVLASYLLLVRREDAAVSRSEGWNASLALAEAGVEEALAQLNAGAASFSVDLSANGWGPPTASGIFNLQSRTLRAGRYDVRYFTNLMSPAPTIISTGYVTLPALSATVARQIKVSTKPVPLINVALAAKYGITVNGSGISSDSFNSADPAHSGVTNGDVASLYGPIDLGSPYIKGDLFLGPTATGGGGLTASQVTGGVHADFNVEYPDVSAPLGAPGGSGWVPDNWPVHDYPPGVNATYVINDNNKILVRPGAKVILYVTLANWSPQEIQVQGTNNLVGMLEVYQASGTATFSGTAPVKVESRRADCFKYFGLAGVTGVTYSGNYNDFVGVIYAPSADVNLNEGSSDMDFTGACIARSVTINGHYNFHFDENLLKVGPIRGYFVKSWQELNLL